jgi:NAD(P)-dependent dehydrogenase (short-subunit alcohol dehydrogenase family)
METGNRLATKVAIVSGAASGIGAETARVFAAQGAKVVACDVNEADGNAVVEAINAAGGEAIFRVLDVADEEQWQALVAETEATFGKVDVLANIAGISGRDPNMAIQTSTTAGGKLVEQSLENWNRIMDINATGTFLGAKYTIPAMIRAGGGSIINISSICGIVGSHSSAAYHASKGAVRILSKAAAVQYAADGVRVNSVHPGFVDTAMTRPAHDNNTIAKQRMDATPLGRFGKPIDIAMGCLYLASDESSWVTGTELVIDGGTVAT